MKELSCVFFLMAFSKIIGMFYINLIQLNSFEYNSFVAPSKSMKMRECVLNIKNPEDMGQ